MTTTEYEQQQKYIADNRNKIETMEKLQKLINTPEWKEVINDLYCDKELKANTLMLAKVRGEESKSQYVSRISAIGHLNEFLDKVISDGEQAQMNLYILAEQNGGN